MPTRICLDCRETNNWRPYKGSKAPQVCSHCGGKMVQAAYLAEQNEHGNVRYVPIPRAEHPRYRKVRP